LTAATCCLRNPREHEFPFRAISEMNYSVRYRAIASSALPPRTDVVRSTRHVRKVPRKRRRGSAPSSGSQGGRTRFHVTAPANQNPQSRLATTVARRSRPAPARCRSIKPKCRSMINCSISRPAWPSPSRSRAARDGSSTICSRLSCATPRRACGNVNSGPIESWCCSDQISRADKDHIESQINPLLYSRAVAHFSATLITFNALVCGDPDSRRIATNVSPRKSLQGLTVSLLFDDASLAALARLMSSSSGCAESSNAWTSRAIDLSSVIAARISVHRECHSKASCQQRLARRFSRPPRLQDRRGRACGRPSLYFLPWAEPSVRKLTQIKILFANLDPSHLTIL